MGIDFYVAKGNIKTWYIQSAPTYFSIWFCHDEAFKKIGKLALINRKQNIKSVSTGSLWTLVSEVYPLHKYK